MIKKKKKIIGNKFYDTLMTEKDSLNQRQNVFKDSLVFKPPSRVFLIDEPEEFRVVPTGIAVF